MADDPTTTDPTAGGGDGKPPDPPGDGGQPPAGDNQPPADDLGDAGKKAIQQEREARKAAEKAAKDAQAELDELRKAQMSDQEKAVEEARREGATETETKFQKRLFAAEAKVAAAGKVADPTLLADPDVAKSLLGLDDIPVNAAGDIDSEAISEAIDRLIEARPFLKAGIPGDATWPSNGSEAGPRGDAKSQLTQDDLKKMSPEEITKARADGRLATLLGRKT